MSVRRLAHIPGFNIDRVAAAAGDDPDVLRLENLDTDIPPPAAAMEATRAAIGEDDANSWLPFTGRDDLKEAVAAYIEHRGGPRYDGRREIVVTSGEGDGMLDALFCLTDPGDEWTTSSWSATTRSVPPRRWGSRRPATSWRQPARRPWRLVCACGSGWPASASRSS
jgi:hypothetical protein